jgi:hypothetical protein
MAAIKKLSETAPDRNSFEFFEFVFGSQSGSDLLRRNQIHETKGRIFF